MHAAGTPPGRSPERLPDSGRAWVAATLVGLLAGALRLVGLSRPEALIFDETYYAKDAWAILTTGAERAWSDDADDLILDGDLSGLTGDAAFSSHPPAGKWVIALGEQLVGMSPLGWRLGVAVLGSLAAAALVLLARRVTRSTWLGVVAGLLLALDGLAIVTARTALLDSSLMAFLVLGTALLVRDRDAYRDWLAIQPIPDVRLWRPWRLAAGAAFGIACATKWSAFPVLATLGLASVIWTAGALAQAGAGHARSRALLEDGPVGALTLVGAALTTYTATWAAWFATADGYLRQWATEQDSASWVPAPVRSWWHYHDVIYTAVAGLDAEHNWASNPVGWLVQARPVLLYREPVAAASDCGEDCVEQVLAVGTPLTWWLGVLALLVMGFLALRLLDWRAWLVLTGVGATWLPWFAYLDRPTFATYAVATLPFLVLGIVVAAKAVLERWPGARRGVALLLATLVILTVVQAWFFWPVWTAEPLPAQARQVRLWLPGWG